MDLIKALWYTLRRTLDFVEAEMFDSLGEKNYFMLYPERSIKNVLLQYKKSLASLRKDNSWRNLPVKLNEIDGYKLGQILDERQR